jgi:hypothetical protein
MIRSTYAVQYGVLASAKPAGQLPRLKIPQQSADDLLHVSPTTRPLRADVPIFVLQFKVVAGIFRRGGSWA